MNTFTSERSYLALLRALLPRGRSGVSPEGGDSWQPAVLPGQNSVEVYGMAMVLAIFHVVWCGDLLGSFWWGLPAGLLLLHLSALLSAVLGGRLWRRYAARGTQAYIGPQCLQWSILALMTGFAVIAPLPRAQWIAWPLLLFLGANLFAWFVIHKWIAAVLILLGHLLALGIWYAFGWQAGLLTLFFVHAVMLYDSLYPHSRIFNPPVRRFPTGTKEVWLTIDDGPTGDTADILDLLDQYGAKATFFLIGRRAQQRPQDVQAIVAHGHTIGNHTFTHPAKTFWMSSWRALQREIQIAQETLEDLSGTRPMLFRGPVGFTPPLLRPILEKHQLTLIGWSARGFDGVGDDAEKAFRRLQRQIQPGSIVLLHQGRPMNIALLRQLLQWLEAEGIRCVLPNLFENEAARLS